MNLEDDPIIAKKRRELEVVNDKTREHIHSKQVSVPFVCGCGTVYNAEFHGDPESMIVTILNEGDEADKIGPCVYRVGCECGYEHQIDVDCNPSLFRVTVGL